MSKINQGFGTDNFLLLRFTKQVLETQLAFTPLTTYTGSDLQNSLGLKILTVPKHAFSSFSKIFQARIFNTSTGSYAELSSKKLITPDYEHDLSSLKNIVLIESA